MAISTHAELKAAISSFKHRSDLSAVLDDIVTLGEKRIMREVRATEMETALSVAISGSGTATVPTGFLGLKYAFIDGSPTSPLTIRSPAQVLGRYPQRSSSSKPSDIAYDAGTFIFGPFPDSTYTVKGTYYARQGPLSSAVYALFTNNPDLFLFACLAETEVYVVNEKRLPMWMAKYESIKDAINTEAKGIAYSGGMQITLG
jgi:hypothetical protein